MKLLFTEGIGASQTTTNAQDEKIPVYETKAAAEADIANLSEGQIIATKDEGNENAKPVDVVEKGNLHAVTSNAVANAIGDKIRIETYTLSSKSVSANSFASYSFSNPHPDWTLLGAFIMSSGTEDANRQWGNVRSDQIQTLYVSIMSQITQAVYGKVIMLFLEA